MCRRLWWCGALALAACVFQGGGAADPHYEPGRGTDVAVPKGYRVELVAEAFDFPSGITFDDEGVPYVIEAGYSYGEVFLTPRIIRLDPSGDRRVIYEGQHPPWNGITFGNGRFYVAEGSQDGLGRILEVDKSGNMRELVTGLPSIGDHHTDGPVFGPDGALYWGQGTATNSGVVGEDNEMMGWLNRHPSFHDIPCEDVVLTGESYSSKNPLTPDEDDDEVLTGPYLPFGTPATPGQVIKGQLPCTGAVFKLTMTGSARELNAVAPVQLVAWGFRNPFGLAFSPEGQLYVTDNGFDERGSRPIFGAGDLLWRVEQGRWYGWPDFSGGRRLDTQRFDAPTTGRPKRLLQGHPANPPKPVAFFAVHSSSNGFDISRSDTFGHRGQAFVAQFGDMAPDVGNVVRPVGFKVVRVNLETGVVHDFAVNPGKKNGPASLLATAGLERPVAARFSPDGNALYVVDFGILLVTDEGPAPQRATGRVWRITHE